MNYQPEIAIVEANTLTCLGLKGILEEMILWQPYGLFITSAN